MSATTPNVISESPTLRFKCIKDHGKLRVRITTPGYNPHANCQFPRAIRVEGREFEAPVSALSFSEQRGKFFYRVQARAVKAVEAIIAAPTTIYESAECVICLANEPQIIFAPCGHFCVCEPCNTELIRTSAHATRQCPMCRGPIGQSVTRDQLQT